MTPKQIRTRTVTRTRHTIYLKKARQFLNAMKSSMTAGDWDAACLNAVHCAISSADALLVHYAGVRSAGESHFDVLSLLKQHVKDPQTNQKAQALGKIIEYKSAAAYEDRELMEADAKEVEKLAERFFEWAKSKLK